MSCINKVLKKKVEGVSSYVATIISIGVICLFLVASLCSYGEVLARNEVERVHRKYVLTMEREGCLTAAKKGALMNELTALGCSNIVITGSLSPVGYGNTIVLKIECDLQVKTMDVAGGGVAGRGVRHVVIEKSGTALY